MTLKISVSIMSHPSRVDQLEKLLNQINDQVNYSVFIDEKNLGVWENAKRAWKAYDPIADYHLVLQDDIILCGNFFYALPKIMEKACNSIPGSSFSFCDNLPVMKYAKNGNMNWLVTTKVKHAQALAQPVSQIDHWIKWSDWHIRPEYHHDGGKLEIYLFKNGKKIWHTIPSLVEHDDQGPINQKDSQIWNEFIPNKGFEFIGEDNYVDVNKWTDNYMIYLPSSLPTIEQWAVGDIEYINPIEHPNNLVFNKPTSGDHYCDVMEKARKKRGIFEEVKSVGVADITTSIALGHKK